MATRIEAPHGDHPLWQEALDLTHAIFSVNIGVNIDLKDNWKLVSYYYLRESCKMLVATYHLLSDKSGKDMVHPAQILIRPLFEYAVQLSYLRAHPQKLDDFLEHSRSNPPCRRSWGKLKEMSKEVDLLEHYNTVYEVTSQRSHGGVRGMKREFFRLLTHEDTPDWEPANVLTTGTMYYRMVVNINIGVFPKLEANFTDFQSGTDWDNRLVTLGNAIREVQATYLEDIRQRLGDMKQ